MTKYFFAPTGIVITRMSAVSWESTNIEVGDDDFAELGHHDDFPSFDPITLPGLGSVLLDDDGNEWLEQHCRLLEVGDDYDVHSNTQPEGLVWDDTIIDACSRVQWLGSVLWNVENLRRWAPSDIREDVTINAVLDSVIGARVQGEIDTLMAMIAEYRAARVEPATLVEPEPEDEVDAALALMRGGVS